MTIHVLGVNSAYHESSACLLRDGEIVATAEEERFNRIRYGKHSRVDNPDELPEQAIAWCLRHGGIDWKDLTAIGYSLLSIADAGVVEGNSGTTNMLFTLSLSEPSQNKVKVYYVTSSGTANAGVDYGSASGSVTFLPGATNMALAVAVYGNTLYESNKTFFVNRSS